MKRTLSEKEIIKIIEKKLPEIIEKYPSIRAKIEEIIERKAVTKEEIKEILLELKAQREENSRRFEEINKRFEEINKRFEDVNRRFEEINERFKDVNRRFEDINRRFEDINRRFEDMNKRFEDVNKRFEEVNKRFEELALRMDSGFKILRDTISAIGSRWGIGAEDAFRKGFEEVLSEVGYKVIKWKKFDKECKFFTFPRPAEIDIIIKDKKKIAIEVKSSLSLAEIEEFEKTVRFYESEENEKIDEKIIVAIFCRPGVEEHIKGLNIKLIKGIEEARTYLTY
ncbi:MAG: DUF3782 domain-containing protein [Candidatus Hydrothermales bacterium]